MSVKIQYKHGDIWTTAFGLHDVKREFGLGYLEAVRSMMNPRPGVRLVNNKTGKVILEAAEDLRPHVGQIAGFPTVEQYLSVAVSALEAASTIREATATELDLIHQALACSRRALGR